MRSGELITSISQLRDSLGTLDAAWNRTREQWRDGKSRNLAENHLQPIAVEMMSAYSAIQRLAEVLSQAERACGPW
jgi:hypothetical protein